MAEWARNQGVIWQHNTKNTVFVYNIIKQLYIRLISSYISSYINSVLHTLLAMSSYTTRSSECIIVNIHIYTYTCHLFRRYCSIWSHKFMPTISWTRSHLCYSKFAVILDGLLGFHHLWNTHINTDLYPAYIVTMET